MENEVEKWKGLGEEKEKEVEKWKKDLFDVTEHFKNEVEAMTE